MTYEIKNKKKNIFPIGVNATKRENDITANIKKNKNLK
ncbi:hypothetical protein BAN_0900003 [Borrelia anserina BA2]|uniref:Uncharacterized protein n=1 Tax=Borrelia anserina BA2 TaxID=1313293 RepID=W5SMQ8_BORAN|nr:hypothetical protein BAN_0900003 [Borrelia anserina BA2]